MPNNKAIIEEKQKLVKLFKYQDAWRKGHYKGYEGGHFLEMRGADLSILSNENKTNAQLKQDIKQLEYITKKGTQQLTTVGEGYYSKNALLEADTYVSKKLKESYIMSKALTGTTMYYLAENEKGDLVKTPYKMGSDNVPIEIEYIMNMFTSNIYEVEGYGTIGLQGLEGKGDEDYKQWLLSQPKVLINDERQLLRHATDFKRRNKPLARQRMHQLKLNLISGMFGAKTGVFTRKVGNTHVERVYKKMKSLSDKDMLYLYSTRQDIFDFSYIYSEEDSQNKLAKIETAIDRFKLDKKKAQNAYKALSKKDRTDTNKVPTYIQYSRAVDMVYGK